MKALSTLVLGRSRFRFIQTALLIASVVGVFGVLSIWAPVGVLLLALVVIAFAGGVGHGKGAFVLVPLTVVAIGVRAELVAEHPVEMQAFLLGTVVIVIALGSIALVGARARRWLRRLSAGQQSSG